MMTTDEFLNSVQLLLADELGVENGARVYVVAQIDSWTYLRSGKRQNSFVLMVVPGNCDFRCPRLSAIRSEISAEDCLANFKDEVIPQLMAALGVIHSGTFDPVWMGC